MGSPESKLINSFTRIKKDMDFLYENIRDLSNQLNQLRVVTPRSTTRSDSRSSKEAILKGMGSLRHDIDLLRVVGSRSSPRSDLDSIEKKILRRLDIVKLKSAIDYYIKEGYKTNQIRDEMMRRFKIKSTCFFKYLNIVRKELRVVATRSNPNANL